MTPADRFHRWAAAPATIYRLRALLLLLGLCGCAYAVVSGGSINESKADAVKEGIQNVRGLRFTANVPLVLESRDEAERLLLAQMERDYGEQRMVLDGITGSLLGLYPARIDVKAEVLKLLKEQVAGFYDPHLKQMILVAGADEVGFWGGATQFMIQRDLVGEMLLAHELTHALQDQHFDLESRLDKLKDNDDQALALKSVAEGDATLAGFAYAMGGLSDAQLDQLLAKLDELPKQFAESTKGVPEGLTVPLIFQYTAGPRFVAEAYRKGGWPAVDALYANPPQSSQQIMHAGVYFSGIETPVEIRVAGYQGILKGWEVADENTIGELQLQIILARNLGGNAPEVALADRWAGDRLVTLRKGKSLTLCWLVMFRDEQSATRFAATYATMLDHILGATTAHRLNYRSRAVLVVIGEGAQQFTALEPAIWAATKVHPMPPPIPAAAPAPSPGAMRAPGGAITLARRSESSAPSR
jgi:hypothetical protein